MVMEMIQLGIVGSLVDMSRLELLVVRSSQTRLRLGVDIQRIGWSVHSSSSIVVLVRVEILLGRFVWFGRMSRRQLKALRSSQSIELVEEHTQQSLRWLHSIDSIGQMVMEMMIPSCRFGLRHRTSRDWFEVLRIVQTIGRVLVGRQRIAEQQVDSKRIRCMEMAQVRKSKFEWLGHTSRDQLMEFGSILPKQLG
jgi:hypothetical protein